MLFDTIETLLSLLSKVALPQSSLSYVHPAQGLPPSVACHNVPGEINYSYVNSASTLSVTALVT